MPHYMPWHDTWTYTAAWSSPCSLDWQQSDLPGWPPQWISGGWLEHGHGGGWLTVVALPVAPLQVAMEQWPALVALVLAAPLSCRACEGCWSRLTSHHHCCRRWRCCCAQCQVGLAHLTCWVPPWMPLLQRCLWPAAQASTLWWSSCW